MKSLNRFNPHLCGTALTGNAGRYAAIDLHLFTDDGKDVEFFMQDSKPDYQIRSRQAQRGNLPDTIYLYAVRTAAAEFEIWVFAHQDRRLTFRSSANGRTFRHAGPDSVEAMLS